MQLADTEKLITQLKALFNIRGLRQLSLFELFFHLCQIKPIQIETCVIGKREKKQTNLQGKRFNNSLSIVLWVVN